MSHTPASGHPAGDRGYVPDRGHIVHVRFDNPPVKTHELKDAHYALVLNPRVHAAPSGISIVMPITSKAKGYPFSLPYRGANVKGVILVDQIVAIDYLARTVQYQEKADPAVLVDAIKLLAKLIVPQSTARDDD